MWCYVPYVFIDRLSLPLGYKRRKKRVSRQGKRRLRETELFDSCMQGAEVQVRSSDACQQDSLSSC